MPLLARDPAVFWRVEKRREELAWRMLAGEEPGDPGALGTMTLLAGGSMHQLNLIGGEIWKLCDGTRDRAAIAAALQTRFDAGDDELRPAVDAFIDDLTARGLVREE
jgi:pyrroloquinoline quinone biosynthesis protein D